MNDPGQPAFGWHTGTLNHFICFNLAVSIFVRSDVPSHTKNERTWTTGVDESKRHPDSHLLTVFPTIEEILKRDCHPKVWRTQDGTLTDGSALRDSRKLLILNHLGSCAGTLEWRSLTKCSDDRCSDRRLTPMGALHSLKTSKLQPSDS
jgi:hypothetical protein